MKKILKLNLVFLCLSLFCIASYASPNLVYHTMDFPNGALGCLEGMDAKGQGGKGGIVRVNVYGDAVVYGYRHNGEDKIILAEHSGYGLGKDIIYIFNPGQWDSPRSLSEQESFSWDMRGLAYDESYFYVANLMQGNITKVRIDDFKIMPQSCDLGSIDTGEVFDDEFGHLAEDVILGEDGYLYAMDQTYYSYPTKLGPGTIVKIDPVDMKVLDWGKVGASPWDMAIHEGHIYVSCFGGSMFTNGYTKEDRPTVHKLPVKNMRGNEQIIADKDLINSPSDEMNGYMLIEIGDDGTIYLTTYQIKDPFSAKVYIGKLSDLSSNTTFTSSTLRHVTTFAGWSRASLMDRTRNICWISDSGTSRNDSKLVALGPDGVLLSYPGSELGGYPNMLALDGPNRQDLSPINRDPSEPALLTPSSNQLLAHGSVNMTWTRSTDPDGDPLTYRVLLAEGGNDPVASQPMTSLSYRPLLSSGKSYSWTVEVSDGRGGYAKAPFRSFSTLSDSGVLFPNLAEDSYSDLGLSSIHGMSKVIDLPELKDYSPLDPVKTGDKLNVKSFQGSGLSDYMNSFSGISLEINPGQKEVYGQLRLSLAITSDDVKMEEGLWKKLMSATSDQESFKVKVLDKIHPVVFMGDNKVDLVDRLKSRFDGVNKSSSLEWIDYFSVSASDNVINITLSAVLVDSGPYKLFYGDKLLGLYDGSSDGVLKLSTSLVLLKNEDDSGTNYSFPSSAGCMVNDSLGYLLILVPLTLLMMNRGRMN